MRYSPIESFVDVMDDQIKNELINRHVEVTTLEDLLGKKNQQSTQIPSMYNVPYRLVQNPSTVSVETFKRMIDTDETIGSGVDFLVSCLVARLGAYQHDNPEVTRHVMKSLTNMQGGFIDTVKEMLSSSWAGFSVSEIIWANKSDGFVPEKIVTLPPSSIFFSVDRYGDLEDDGILQYQRYNPLLGGSLLGMGNYSTLGVNGFFPSKPDPLAKFGDYPFPQRMPSAFQYMSIRIPKMKCVHLAWNSQGRFGNPYGRSLLRRAYNWWVMKWAFAQMLGVALDRKGTPLMIIYADPNFSIAKAGAGEKPKREDTQRAPEAASAAFRNVHNDSVIVLPGKKDQHFAADKMDVSSNAEDFIGSIQLCNTMMLRALLIPALVFSSGDGAGSFALGQEHSKTFDKILDGYLEGVKAQLIDQLVKPIVCYNFDREVWQEHGFGTFARRELTMDERQKEVQVFETGISQGIIDNQNMGDLNKMREALGFEPRTEPIQQPMMLGGLDEDGNPIQPPGGDDEEQEPAGAAAGASGAGRGRPGAARRDDADTRQADA